MFPLWFTEKYLTGANWKLFIGGLFFWNTMYLLRYGLFLAFTGAASFVCTFPIKGTFALLALAQLCLMLLDDARRGPLHAPSSIAYPIAAVGVVLMFFEKGIIQWLRKTFGKSAEKKGRATSSDDSSDKIGATIPVKPSPELIVGSSFPSAETTNLG